jgi:uncharacterized protein (DUF2342 family)
MSDLIEAMARAISETGGAVDWDHAVTCATAALAALRETHHLVPRTDGDDGELVEQVKSLRAEMELRFTGTFADNAVNTLDATADRITALSAEVERLTAFIERLTTDVCACGVMPGVTCLGCQCKAALGAKP